jgi:hypothetical protein
LLKTIRFRDLRRSNIELVPKDKDFGLQGSPRPEQPDDSTPDQSAEIAHRGDYQPIRR